MVSNHLKRKCRGHLQCYYQPGDLFFDYYARDLATNHLICNYDSFVRI